MTLLGVLGALPLLCGQHDVFLCVVCHLPK